MSCQWPMREGKGVSHACHRRLTDSQDCSKVNLITPCTSERVAANVGLYAYPSGSDAAEQKQWIL